MSDDLFALLDAKASQAPTVPVAPIINLSGIAALSGALTLPDDVAAPIVPGMTRDFLPHQAVAYHYALGAFDRWPGVFIGDDMGLGKTQVMQALIARTLADRGGYALVIAPPVTAGGWASDLRAAFPGLRFAQIKGRKAERDDQGRVVLPDADVIFISDDPLTLRAWLTDGIDARTKRFNLTNVATGASMMVRDEIHRDKGADGRPGTPTSRAKLMLTLGDAIRGHAPIVAASGSITVNRPIEALIPMTILGSLDLLKALAPGIRNAIGFAFRYCAPVNNGFGYSYAGADRDRLPELHENMRSTVYVRRDKQAIGNLPHFGWHVIPYALNGKLARLKRLEAEFLDLIREEEGPEAMWRKARAEAITRMQAMWQEAGAAKGQAAIDYLLDEDQGVGLTAGKPVILFYWHEACLTAMQRAMSPVRIEDPALGLDAKGKPRTRPLRVGALNGKVTGDARQHVVDGFQAGDYDVLCAQLKSAGVGVTLTAAADAIFVQTPWSAGDLAQAAGRILRTDVISRDRAAAGIEVGYHVLLATHENGDPTFDHAQFAMVEAKAQITDAINSGTEITMPEESIMFGALRQWYADRNR